MAEGRVAGMDQLEALERLSGVSGVSASDIGQYLSSPEISSFNSKAREPYPALSTRHVFWTAATAGLAAAIYDPNNSPIVSGLVVAAAAFHATAPWTVQYLDRELREDVQALVNERKGEQLSEVRSGIQSLIEQHYA